MIYLIALLLGIIAGLRFVRDRFTYSSYGKEHSGLNPIEMEIEKIKESMGQGKTKEEKEEAKAKAEAAKERKRKARPKKKRSWLGRVIDLRVLVTAMIVALVVTAFMDFTWAYYIGPYPTVIMFVAVALLIGWFSSVDVRSLKGIGPTDALKGVLAVFATAVIPVVFTFIHAYVSLVLIMAVFIYVGRKAFDNKARALMAVKGYAGLFCVALLIVGVFNPMVHPEGVENSFYESLEENETKAMQTRYITDLDEIRVISWDLATQYLQRAYGDSASILSTDAYYLAENTDPTYVGGKFVWVNAPQYESWKWLGDKDVPFYVYVVNEPEMMADENPDIVHREEDPFNVHQEKIEWKDRLWNLMFDKYAGQYEVTQIRIDLDDNYDAYFIVYLSERGVIYNLPTLKKILIVSVEDINDYEEYDVDDLGSIPDWLEVVYPNKYVYEWIDYWGSYRNGLIYSWFNKKHLYDPDDIDPRFLIIQNKTFWQMPMRQKDSEVLGGFIQVDTRTGEATFWNREDKSYVSKWTIERQILSYLSSGELGFQQLTIHEGYLYPLKLDDGTIREAYIFPLYAGFTVQKYAVVDAEYYTAAPLIDTSLDNVLVRYKARGSGGTGENVTWESRKVVNAYAETEVVVMTLEGANNTSQTFVVTEEDLENGFLTQAGDEWLELKLAVAEHTRTGNVTLDVAIDGGTVTDVDYLKADLVIRP